MFINLLCIPLTIATQTGVLCLFSIQFFRGHSEPFDNRKFSIKIRKSNEVAGTAFFSIREKTGHLKKFWVSTPFFTPFFIYMEDTSYMNIIKSLQWYAILSDLKLALANYYYRIKTRGNHWLRIPFRQLRVRNRIERSLVFRPKCPC